MIKVEEIEGYEILKEIAEHVWEQTANVPVLKETYDRFWESSQKEDYNQHILDVSDFILKDPFCSFKMMELSAKRQHSKHENLEADINCLQKAILLFGMKTVFNLALNSAICLPDKDMERSIKKAQYSANIAKKIAIFRYDVLPDEVALANLMADLGELMLCIFKPELVKTVRVAMDEDLYPIYEHAQLELCGFEFRDLSLVIAHRFGFPPPIINLMDMHGEKDVRHQVAKVCSDIANHVFTENGYLNISSDVIKLRELIGINSSKEILEMLQLNRYMKIENAKYVVEKLNEYDNPENN